MADKMVPASPDMGISLIVTMGPVDNEMELFDAREKNTSFDEVLTTRPGTFPTSDKSRLE